MNRPPNTVRHNRYEAALKRQRLFSRLQMLSLPIVLLILAVPAFILFKAHKTESALPEQSDALPADVVQTASVQSDFNTQPSVAGMQERSQDNLLTNSPSGQSRVADIETAASGGEDIPLDDSPLGVEARMLAEEELLEIRRMEARILAEQIDATKSMLDTGKVSPDLTAISETPASGKPELLDELWLVDQDQEQYVVQIASSTNYDALVDYVNKIPSDEPKVIYPFQSTKQGEFVYGASIGVYQSRKAAIDKATSLSDTEDLNGAWVRPIEEISTQINAVKKLN